MATNFHTSSVKELQTFLKDRGIIFSNQKKVDLIELCSAADELGLEIDRRYYINFICDVLQVALQYHMGH